MELLRCPKCGAENALDARFCQKCGARLLTACLTCGTENLPGATFCKNCGVDLSKAEYVVLSWERAGYWRSILGCQKGWEPPKDLKEDLLSAYRKGTVEALAKLTPSFDIVAEEPIFWVLIDIRGWGRHIPNFKVRSVTMHGFKHQPWSIFVATGSRLFASQTKDEKRVDQVAYDQIIEFEAKQSSFFLRLKDGSQVVIDLDLPGFSLLAAAVIATSPAVAKGQVAMMERKKVDDARSFAFAFAEFFREIVAENKKRGS